MGEKIERYFKKYANTKRKWWKNGEGGGAGKLPLNLEGKISFSKKAWGQNIIFWEKVHPWFGSPLQAPIFISAVLPASLLSYFISVSKDTVTIL